MRIFPLSEARTVYQRAYADPLTWGAVAAGLTAVWLVCAMVPGGFILTSVAVIAALIILMKKIDNPGQGLRSHVNVGQPLVRLLIVGLLLVILIATVMGTALVALAFLFAAFAMVALDRSGVENQPEGVNDAFALFGPTEWLVASPFFIAFGLLAIWILARTFLSFPASFRNEKIQVLSIWPLTSAHLSEIVTAWVQVLLPGLFVTGLMIWLQNPVLQDSWLMRPLPALAFAVGVLPPLAALMLHLHARYSVENADRLNPDNKI